jgi:hypothetical protein
VYSAARPGARSIASLSVDNDGGAAMSTRYSDQARSGEWLYPTDVDGFLTTLGTSRDNPAAATFRVEIFLLSHGGPLMPPALRAALNAAGLMPAKTPTRPPGTRR